MVTGPEAAILAARAAASTVRSARLTGDAVLVSLGVLELVAGRASAVSAFALVDGGAIHDGSDFGA
jgi:hypothetical protein